MVTGLTDAVEGQVLRNVVPSCVAIVDTALESVWRESVRAREGCAALSGARALPQGPGTHLMPARGMLKKTFCTMLEFPLCPL